MRKTCLTVDRETALQRSPARKSKEYDNEIERKQEEVKKHLNAKSIPNHIE